MVDVAVGDQDMGQSIPVDLFAMLLANGRQPSLQVFVALAKPRVLAVTDSLVVLRVQVRKDADSIEVVDLYMGKLDSVRDSTR